MIGGFYLAYTSSRVLADDNLEAAIRRATWIQQAEQRLHLAWEAAACRWFADHASFGLVASYWYCTAHYIITATVLLWLYRRGHTSYVPARRALAVTTVLGLSFYLAAPTAPPRLAGSYVDVLSLHAASGWWGTDASAPRGLGHLTNELAAFPSLHAGWSLWVALAVTRAGIGPAWRAAAWAYPVITAVVVVGTANHWTLDVLAGWLVTFTGWAAVRHSRMGTWRTSAV